VVTAIDVKAILDLKLLFRRKVRDIYDLGEQLLMVPTDRISAYDVVLPTRIPDKGRVLTLLSKFWFDRLGIGGAKMDLSKGSMRGWVAVILCGAFGFAACTEQKATESAASVTGSKSAAPVAKQPVEPPGVGAPIKVPPKELAKLEGQLGEVSERIGKLKEDSEAADSKTVQELDDERSRISKELQVLRIVAEENWRAARDRLQNALRQLTERLDRLEKSESPS